MNMEEKTAKEGDDIPTLEEFISSNYRLFTVIATFAALSVYLTQLQEVSREAIRIGVGGALLLFALAMIVALRKSFSLVQLAIKDGSYLLSLTYAIIMYAFIGLLSSIFLIMSYSYPKSSGGLLASGILLSGIFVYLSVFFNSKIFTEFEGATIIEYPIRFTPYLSASVLLLFFYLNWRSGNPIQLIYDNPAATLGSFAGLLILHILLTITLYILLRAIDTILDNPPSIPFTI